MFCPKCGFDAQDANFCAKCGADLSNIQIGGKPEINKETEMPTNQKVDKEVVLWEGKPEGLGDKAKMIFNDTRYKVTNERIIVTDGLIGKKQVEVELRHVKDIQVKQSITDRLAKVGDITVYTTDITEGTLVLTNVLDAFTVKDIIRRAVLDIRDSVNVQYHERI
ncbi:MULTISPECIES: PH domain-containing protein [unclassified Breznakia]|uniref:PH domain-containing protein n=1 Tax=unclassified Breznakia TaxID=2623764 RepID=UPI002476B106|nr:MULTISPECIES: PH domain-containing protein [unclassified Breznakia]MDH6368043.1 hypothetical protein [Breznakia sp. PH1-1]MDH6405131.1 hypothetical protein [Breznakia sp. PF1-11]MDH6412846.1 hypothetical protein [Breznakia sp. PFB1-11]MDH6415212.1 hypothetical protein [Breznakia sp. PFB1-14]MDH6417522.1 hypothetical protein [Breznakia sp. PFB1-4]